MSHSRMFTVALILTCAVSPLARAAATILTTPDAGTTPTVRPFPYPTLTPAPTYNAYNPAFTGGVRIAAADFNADGTPDHVVGPGPGGGPQVNVFDGGPSHALLASYFAFAPTFTGGVSVAAADVTHDGHPDVIAATASAAGEVRVFDSLSASIVRDFQPFGPTFTGGLSVAAGDVNGDGYADIIAAPAGTGYAPEVRVYSGANGALLRDFYAYAPTFTGGLTVAAADVNGDGLADIVTGAGPGGSPQVSVFRGTDASQLRTFLAYPAAFTGGVRVAAADLDGDGYADLVTVPGPGAGPQVNVYSGATGNLLTTFFADNPALTNGLFVAATPAVPEPATSLLAITPVALLVRRRTRSC